MRSNIVGTPLFKNMSKRNRCSPAPCLTHMWVWLQTPHLTHIPHLCFEVCVASDLYIMLSVPVVPARAQATYTYHTPLVLVEAHLIPIRCMGMR